MRYVERCLYEYKANVALIEALEAEKNELSSIHTQSFGKNPINGVSDPVCDVVWKVIQIEKRIANIKKITNPVDKLQGDLSGNELRVQQMREVLKLKYINHEGNDKAIQKMAVSRRTFWRRVRELLYLAGKYFGQA